jgi:hypothetical protein
VVDVTENVAEEDVVMAETTVEEEATNQKEKDVAEEVKTLTALTKRVNVATEINLNLNLHTVDQDALDVKSFC